MTDQSRLDADEVIGRLTRFLGGHADFGDSRISSVDRAGAGLSRDNWLFDLVTEGADGLEHREPFIVRIDPGGGLVETDRSVEFAVLRGLEPSELPTPVARWLDGDGDVFGRPSLIMERLPGTCDYRILRNANLQLTQRVELARRFCELLAQVHAVNWDVLSLGTVLRDPGRQAARAELDRWTTILRADQLEPWPELEYAIAELRETAPESNETVLVHSDFKPGNLLLSDGTDGLHVTALLDWELAHLGDPLEDLGWVTQPLRAAEHTIDGSWEAADLVAYYETIVGHTVDPTALAWWVTFSSLKTAIMQISGLRAFLEGHAREPYWPTRRVLSTLLDAVAADGKGEQS